MGSEMCIRDSSISELKNVITEKKKKEEEGFKKEYAVSKQTWRKELHNNNGPYSKATLTDDFDRRC